MAISGRQALDNDMPFIDPDNDITFLYTKADNRIAFSKSCREQFPLPPLLEHPTINTLLKMIRARDPGRLENILRQYIKLKTPFFFVDFAALGYGGQEKKFYLKAAASYDKRGCLAAMRGLVFDLSDTYSQSDGIRQQAYIDQLTKLPNRKAFRRNWEKELKKSAGSGYIILTDIDNLHHIQAMFGFAASEKVIWLAARRLSGLLREHGGTLYRVMGGAYLSTLPDITAAMAEKLMSGIQSHFKREKISINGKGIHITLSSGAVPWYGSLDYSADELLLNAELAVQKVKQSGKDGYSFYTRGDGILYKRQYDMLSDIEKSVEAGCQDFELYYQPIFSTSEFRCVGAEALLRWNRQNSDMIMPGEFVPILEKTGLILEVERWIFKEACIRCKKWIELLGDPDFFVHINLSSKQIARKTLFDEVMSSLQESGLPPSNLVLETTESSLMLELEKGVSLFNRFRAQGVRIAVDDFGTGYSSLSYLRHLPVDEIKVDKSFVAGIEQDTSAKDFLGGVINVIRSMKCHVCVEGVETDRQREILATLKVDSLQGYLFSKPVSTGDFEAKYGMSPELMALGTV